MKKWLSELGIGEELIIDMDDEGLGFKMYLSGRKGRESLADCGHGVTQIVSILLMIESAIMEYEMQKGDREPIFGKTIYERLTDSIIAIEEPEVSLHPNYQSKLASMFEDASCNYGVRISFIIETHSEYLVRKTQTIVARYNDDKFKENPFSVYYFNEDGTAYRVEYTRSGRFANSFGPGFVDEADNPAMSLLSIKVSN